MSRVSRYFVSYCIVSYRRRCIVVRLLLYSNNNIKKNGKLSTSTLITTFNIVHPDYLERINERKSFQRNTSVAILKLNQVEKNVQRKKIKLKEREREKSKIKVKRNKPNFDTEEIAKSITNKIVAMVFLRCRWPTIFCKKFSQLSIIPRVSNQRTLKFELNITFDSKMVLNKI